MDINRVYTLGSAKRLIKFLKIKAGEELKKSEYLTALFYYKRAYETAVQWNLTREIQKLSAHLSNIKNFVLKMELDKHLEAAKKYEANGEQLLALDHLKAASLIASELKKEGLAEMNDLFNEIEAKLKNFENYASKQITMTLNNGHLYKTPVILSKALELIDSLPASFQLEENFIEFENYKNQKLFLKRISINSWIIELKLSEKPFPSLNYKYLTTNVLKVIVLNFIKGYFIGDLLTKCKSRKEQYQQLIKIINTIRTILKDKDTCEFCNKKILRFGQNKCEYCESLINYDRFLFSHLNDKSFAP